MTSPVRGRPYASIFAFRAGVFDLDGVITRTAALHAAAWKRLFDDFLHRRAARTGTPFRPFSNEDYRRHVDGKPRRDGVRDFLAARGIALPEGTPDDPPEQETIHGLGAAKNALFRQLLATQGVEIHTSLVTLIHKLRRAGLRTALVSSSKNAAAVLAAAGLTELFDVRVDGVEAARLGLAGKPAPDIFRHAAAELRVDPADAFAVEDALSGVAAARAAGYGLVIGVDRAGQADALREHGADVVVPDLAALPFGSAPLPDALERFADIARLLAGRRPALFLDYDGTLTPIVERPELAVLDDGMRAALRELAALCPLAIVSGRDRADVARLVGIDSLVYAGSHGFDIAGPDGLRLQHAEAADYLPALDRAEAWLRARLASIPGALVERKRYAIAVHYRLVADAQAADVEAVVDAALAEAPEQLRKTGGKKVFELRVRLPWDKGHAVDWLLATLRLERPDVLPMYLGDDETDEDAFLALRRRGGLGILVAAEPALRSAAHYRLVDPAAAGRFLGMLTELLRP